MNPFKLTHFYPLFLIGALSILVARVGMADETHTPLIDITPQTDLSAFKCTKSSLSLGTDSGGTVLSLKLQANQGFPGFHFAAPNGTWDLSAAKGVRAVVTNPNDAPMSVSLRIENDVPGEKEPWSTASFVVGPGTTAFVQTVLARCTVIRDLRSIPRKSVD